MTELYKLPPSVSASYTSSLPSGTVKLYADPSWNSSFLTITTSASIEGEHYAFTGTNLNDRATWVAFNLPTGVVMTLLEHKTTPVATEPYNFKGCGRCIDLIGNGTTQTVDLPAVGINDCLGAYVWRQVDLNTGVFQLFDGLNYADNRNTFFLSEWPMGKVQSLEGWFICDRAASVYFGGLTAQSVKLYDGGQGDGEPFSFAGWLSVKGYEDLNTQSFRDRQGSWSWSLLPPVHSTVEPFTIKVPASATPSKAITNFDSGTNTGSATLIKTVSVSSGEEQSLTLSVTDSYTIGSVQDVQFTYEKLGSEIAVGCSFSQSYTYTGTKETTVTQYYDLNVSQTIDIPANCAFSSELKILMTKIPASSFSTQGTFYYDQQVPGSTLDPEMSAQMGKDIYALVQTVTGQIAGGVSVETLSSTVTTPLATAAAAASGAVLEQA